MRTLWLLAAGTAVSLAGAATAADKNPQAQYARSLLEKAAKGPVQLTTDQKLTHREAFRIVRKDARTVIEGGSSAGLIYGAAALTEGDFKAGAVQKPDFDIRGTTLCLMPHSYRATLSPKLYPWFYDKAFMARTLDAFAAARLNTIFLWAGHLFPYIVEMPDYPEAAADVPPEQVKANQAQFRWFTGECRRRNIQVLLHFYNIHVSPPFARKHRMRTNPTTPTPLLNAYVHYALTRYFKEFGSVGLYACPGEPIHSKHQLTWFRDVVFDAAKKSGKNPVIVIRDWTMNKEFRASLKTLYGNVYSELKHNDESLTSPCPDVRILQLEGIAAGHIVNFHLVTDLVPMRWGSPVLLQESMRHLKALGFVKGVEFFGQTFWKWPYTLDKLDPSQKGYSRKGPKLLSLDRDAIYFHAFGRYLWRSDRDPAKEREYWQRYLAGKFGSPKTGELLYRWYVTSGPISPGLQNLNATKVAGWWPAVMLHNQRVDQILTYNKRLDETPYTLYRETGRAGQRYYPRPFDAFFVERYRKAYGVPTGGKGPAMYKEFAVYKQRLGIADLAQRHCMPVSQYADALAAGRTVTEAMTPDKVASLLNTLAKESLALARGAVQHAGDPDTTKELERVVTDSEMYVLATEALRHKVQAALLKARMLRGGGSALRETFAGHMAQSVKAYQKLAGLTQRTYLHGNDLMGTHWQPHGLREFQQDLSRQRAWLTRFNKQPLVLPDGSVRIEAESMTGPWRKGNDKYAGYLGTGYAASWYAAKESTPAPMTASVRIAAAGEYTVWIRALVGGSHQDRALAVEIAGKRLAPTHAGKGPKGGAFVWAKAGRVKLPAAPAALRIHPVGKRHATADVLLLVPDADWKPAASK